MTLRLLTARALAAALAAAGAAQAAAPAKPWKAPRAADGHPELGGLWTNVSMTPENRPAKFGARGVYTPDEVKAIESAAVKEVEDANQNVDTNAPPPPKGGDTPPPGTRPEFVAAAGGTGGYDRGWLDPGSHIMRVRGEPRTSILTTPDGRVPKPKPGVTIPNPYAGGLGRFDNPEDRSLADRCIVSFGRNGVAPMLANGFYNNNYQIVQTPGEVAIVTEMVHDVRHIPIGGQHRTDGLRPWFGDSVGRWDGDTLVVETVNIPERQAYYGSWKELKVTERFTRVGPHRLHYAFVVDDPSRWDKAWGGEYEFNSLDQPIYEYACHEGNHALPGMLAGARAQERAAAEAKAKTAKGAD